MKRAKRIELPKEAVESFAELTEELVDSAAEFLDSFTDEKSSIRGNVPKRKKSSSS
jgi:Mg2+ and Co2+ transporter CorA